MYESLAYSFSPATYCPDIQANQDALDVLCATRQLDCLIITSQDFNLSEYVPLSNNPRFAVSGFTGSMGNGIFIPSPLAKQLGHNARFTLFLDGRYHLQGSHETEPHLVILRNMEQAQGLWQEMCVFLKHLAEYIQTVGFDSHRISLKQLQHLKQQLPQTTLISLDDHEIDSAVQLPGWIVKRPIFQLKADMVDRDPAATLKALIRVIQQKSKQENVCFMTCLGDDMSFLLNTRGYHLPNAASHLGYLFITQQKNILYLTPNCASCEVNIDSLPLSVIRANSQALADTLKHMDIKAIAFDAQAINAWLYQHMEQWWPNIVPWQTCQRVKTMRASKTEAELACIKTAFMHSSKAIATSLRWAKLTHDQPTEHDLSQKICQSYEQEGAVDLSFSTIAASGANGAIIHYTQACVHTPLLLGDLVLLDSGAYYEAGFATDCTRTILRTADQMITAEDWQTEIYTITLKAAIKGLTATFDLNDSGQDLDALVRNVVKAYGYDYNHGTGHGVGIHVHEDGIRASTAALDKFIVNAVLTIEPGIYLPGKGGVRIENVIIVRLDTKKTRYYFEPLVFVGYDWDLINLNMLDKTEIDYLRAYEMTCQQRGTAVTTCPLLGH